MGQPQPSRILARYSGGSIHEECHSTLGRIKYCHPLDPIGVCLTVKGTTFHARTCFAALRAGHLYHRTLIPELLATSTSDLLAFTLPSMLAVDRSIEQPCAHLECNFLLPPMCLLLRAVGV